MALNSFDTSSSDVAGPTCATDLLEDQAEESSLPIYKCINPRNIVKPKLIDPNEIGLKCNTNIISKKYRKTYQVARSPVPKDVCPLLFPKYPLTLMWNPAIISFVLHYDRVVNRLRIFNSCIRPIYIQIYGLWDQSARLGASWCCRPRTRILLAPGMMSYLAIIATPREESPIPLAHIGLQLAATHMRDRVVGYFYVPIEVKFLNCKTIDDTEESMVDFDHADSHVDGGSKFTVFPSSEGTVLVVTDTDGSTYNK